MTLISRAGRFAGMSVMVGLLLAGCNKGPDRAQVAADLQKSVEDYLAQVEGPQDKRVVSHSAVKVSPQQDAGYLVAIDGLKIGEPGQGYLDVGTVTYVLTPKDDKTYDASQLTIPGDMQIKTSDGKSGGDLKLANKAFSGTWLRDAQSFTKLDLELADLVLTDPAHGTAKMAGATFTVDSTDKGSGLWDQNGKLALTGIDVSDQTDGHVSIKEVDVTSAIQGLKLIDYTAKLKAMREAMAKPAPAATASTSQGSTTQSSSSTGDSTTTGDAAAGTSSADAAVRDFAAALPTLLSTFGSDFHLSGLSYQAPDQASSFDLGKAGFALTATGFDQPKATVKFSIDHDALVLHGTEAQNELIAALVPANGALIISLNGVPTKDLTALFADAAVTFGHSDPAAMEAQSALLFARLQQLMQQDGVTVTIEPSHLTSVATNVNATGQFSVQASAVHGAVGSLDIGITGLDQVIALAQKQSDQDPEAAQYVAMVQSLLTYAQREQGSDGKPIDKFKVDVPQTGPLSVNGKPLPF
jgi:hypothetical protein